MLKYNCRCKQEKAASAPAGGSGARQGRQQNQQSQQNDSIVQTVMVPANLHTRVTQGGKFFRTLPNGIKIDHGDVKPPSNTAATSSTPSSNAAAKAARIDEEEGEESEFGWEVTPLSSTSAQDNGEEIPWNIRGNDQEKVERVEAMIKSALERTKTETHKGVLTVPQSLVPRSESILQCLDDDGWPHVTGAGEIDLIAWFSPSSPLCNSRRPTGIRSRPAPSSWRFC